MRLEADLETDSITRLVHERGGRGDGDGDVT